MKSKLGNNFVNPSGADASVINDTTITNNTITYYTNDKNETTRNR